MMTRESMAGLAAFGIFMLSTVPAIAQVRANTHEVHIYAGEMFGDDLTGSAVSGQTPKLDDKVTYGLRYGYNFTDSWGLDLSLGHSPNSVKGLAGGDVDLDLTTFDVDAVWHFNPSARFVPYVLAGVGYATAKLDRPIVGTVNGQNVSIGDDSGFTLNAGVGAKYFVTDQFLIRLEARYRYLNGIVDSFDQSMNTFETTLGVGWRF